MFTPSKDEVRRFFRETWQKHRESRILTPLETIALDWIVEHPEYHELLSQQATEDEDYRVDEGRTNPFLHLSMHLSILEQTGIDQPAGIRQAVELLAARRQSLHRAHHEVMECLGEMIWSSQRSGLPPDGHAYIDCVRRRATA
jgi:hypothetical protein